MKLYRIATTAHIKDLSGAGARLYGGRWNEKGVAVIYTSESRALAVLEYLVHLPMVFAPGELSIMELKVPDFISPREVDRRSLPSDWRSYPALEALAAIGTHGHVQMTLCCSGCLRRWSSTNSTFSSTRYILISTTSRQETPNVSCSTAALLPNGGNNRPEGGGYCKRQGEK